MTKRKASVALDSVHENNSNSLKLITGSNSNNNNTSTPDICNSNNGNNTAVIISGGVSHQNGTAPNPTSMGNTDNCRQQQDTSNNQNDNSVESESSGNNSAAGNQHKSKKERADNWSSAEIQILHKGIESRRDVFYGPPSQATKKNRESAWEAITREVNAVSTTPRSLSQVMKKFKNEKCRAKRKFTDPDKDGHGSNDNNGSNSNLNCNNNVSNSSTTINRTTNNDATATINLSDQNQTTGNQQQPSQTQHHMTNPESMSAPQSSINVVKLAPQNVAKTMIDLPGHVQHIQMPHDDMVLIVPPDMDSLLSGVNIVSDVNGHHHFQKCPGNGSLNNHPHNQHSQHPLQTLNTSQSLVNGTMSNGMMTRAPFCILNQVECTSSGNETNGAEHHHVTQSVVSQTAFSTNHIGIGTQNLTHHRGAMIDQNQGQQQHHHQLHHHPQQQQHQQQQQSQHQPHPSQLTNPHNQHHLPQNHLATTTAVASTGGVAIESQLKNLLFNLLLKDGQQTSNMPILQPSNQESKHRSDMLAIIASSLTKIEGHLSKISKVATTLMAHNMNLVDSNERTSNQSHSSSASALNISSSDGNNNNVDVSAVRGTNRQDDDR